MFADCKRAKSFRQLMKKVDEHVATDLDLINLAVYSFSIDTSITIIEKESKLRKTGSFSQSLS